MSVHSLLDPDTARSSAALATLTSRSWDGTDFVYLLWDAEPAPRWLPVNHPARQHLRDDRVRPLYLGKATSWGSVARHLPKDGFAASLAVPNAKNADNQGLLAYCLGKSRPGWLRISLVPCKSRDEARNLEKLGVDLLGWRRDFAARKTSRTGWAKQPIAAGQAVWSATLSELKDSYADLFSRPTPVSEGVLLNQSDPVRDTRGLG